MSCLERKVIRNDTPQNVRNTSIIIVSIVTADAQAVLGARHL